MSTVTCWRAGWPGRGLERTGDGGPGGGPGCRPAGRADRARADDLAGRAGAEDARRPAPRRPAGCRRERGRAGTGAALAPGGDGDGEAAGRLIHIWHRTSGLWHVPAAHAPGTRTAARAHRSIWRSGEPG